jgi:DNA-binding winged helix-turn-helix (wHTH) protein/Tol biopolymer transport system component
MVTETFSGPDFWVGDCLVRPSLARLERGAEAVHVTPRAMAVLCYLANAGGRVVSRNELLDAVWPRMDVTQDALSQCVVELRKAFGDDPRRPAIIETIPKIGIRLIAPVTHAKTPLSAAPRNTPGAEPRLQAGDAPPGEAAAVGKTARAARLPSALSAPAAPVAALAIVVIATTAFWLSERAERPWRDPLQGADFAKLTDFLGAEEHAAISRDGRLVAFVSDRDGAWDAWVGPIGTGDFENLTSGRLPDLRNPAVRMLSFSPSGTDVLIWTKTTDANGVIVDHGWTMPILGGALRNISTGISELDWSPDGERIVYHPSAPGDPLFVRPVDEDDAGEPIHIASPGIHCHFPLWSRDGSTIYFVRGFVPDEMDLWRVPAAGGVAEQLTHHNSRVSFPTLLDERTLLYLATAPDGSGPWVHVLDLETLDHRRIKTAGGPYTSIAASADGQRLVVTEARPTATLWRVQLDAETATTGDATEIPVRTQRGASPRFGPGFIVYRAPKAGTDGLWRQDGPNAQELWSGVDGRVVAGPALTRAGDRLAFAVQKRGLTRIYVMNADGSDVRRIARDLDVRGAPAWSPDGAWIAVAAMRGGVPRLFKIPSAGSGPPIPLGDDYARDPVWSPSGRFLVYSGRDVGTTFEIKAIDADGTPKDLPTLFLNRGSRRLDFFGENEDKLVVLKGALSHKEFWAIDLRTGQGHPLTELGEGPIIDDFDVSADGTEIVFDRIREESDIVRIDRRG